MDGTLIIILIGIAVAITYFAMRSEINQQIKRWEEEKELLERRVDAYDKYLTKNCKYERPFRRYNGDWLVRDPMTDEFNYHMFMDDCHQYETEHKDARVDGCVDIDGALYDLRESKYNKLVIENFKTEKELYDLRTRIHLFEWIIMELERKDKNEVEIEKVWEKISKQAKLTEIIPSYKILSYGDLSGDVENVDEAIARAKKWGKPLTNKRIDELKKRANKQALRNALVDDFQKYLNHEYCDNKECRSEKENKKECQELRKKFQRYEDD